MAGQIPEVSNDNKSIIGSGWTNNNPQYGIVSGVLSIEAGATLDNNKPGGVTVATNGQLYNQGIININTGSRLFTANAPTERISLYNIGNIIFNNDSVWQNDQIGENYGLLDFKEGTLIENSKLINGQRGTIVFRSGARYVDDTVDNSGILINHGTIDSYVDNLYNLFTSGNVGKVEFGESSTFSNYSTWSNNRKTSINHKWHNALSASIQNNAVINANNVFENYGAVVNDGTLNNNGVFSNNGTITVNDGTLNNNGALSNNGTIDLINAHSPDTSSGAFVNMATYQGSGKIIGSWTDHGTVKPGNSAGGMLIDGHYIKGGGTKEIELGGTYHGDGDRTATDHDWIEITGDLELAGKLDVSLIDGFKLSAGDSFVITKVDGDLSGEYDGLKEGDSVGRFKSDNGGTIGLFVTYQGGDGNDIQLYTKSFLGVLPESLREPRIIGSDADDSLTGTSADEVIFGGSDDDVLLGAQGDDRVTGGNGDDWLDGGYGDDTLKGDRGADTYTLSRGDDVIIGFSFAENDRISVADGVEISLTQVGDDLLLKGNGVHTTLLDVDRGEFFVADVIDFI